MTFPRKYRCLNSQVFGENEFKIIAIRFEDKDAIREWRNAQIDILRQDKRLSEKDQNDYFLNVVSGLFDKEHPTQVLMSFLQNNVLIGYGGLVHIDWKSKHAEISFLLSNENNSEKRYLELFPVFLELIESCALELGLHKIHSYGYQLEDYRFKPLIDANFDLEATLEKHKFVQDKLVNVLIYGKLL